jgi:squalene-associated FAD-dependent desaturase
MTVPRAHVVGAGLAGLAAAVALSREGAPIEISEAAAQAGGRCRSYLDRALGMTVDNGNHLVLSGNRATLGYLAAIGASLDALPVAVPFVDLRGRRWTISPTEGPVPWWIFIPSRRVPDTGAADYLKLAGLLRGRAARRVKDAISCEGALWERLIRPFLLAALNTDPEEAAADLAGAVVRETLARGAAACRPLIATAGLSATFVDPALQSLERSGTVIRYGRRLRRVIFGHHGGEHVVTALDFGGGLVPIAPGEVLVLAVPPWVARDLVPDLTVPDDFRPIVNAHFRIAPFSEVPAMTGVLGGTAEWIFVFPDRISVTVSNAERLVDMDRERIAAVLWRDVSATLGCESPLPPWNIVVEKRATFAATPEQSLRRPGVRTRWANLFLAGDWIDTGLPAAIEGAVRSGQSAARLATERLVSQGRSVGYAEGLTHRIARS